MIQNNMQKKPTILCFGRFCDAIPGGTQRHVENLFLSLSEEVNYVHLVPSRDWSESRFLLHGVPVVRKPSFNIDGSLAFSPGLVSFLPLISAQSAR